MDLSHFETKSRMDTGTDMPLRDPKTNEPVVDKEGKPITIKLCGFDSSRYKAVVRDRVKQGKPIDAERDIVVDDLVTLTVGWSPNLGFGKQDPLPFSAENARMLYENCFPIRLQASVWVANAVNFTAASSKS